MALSRQVLAWFNSLVVGPSRVYVVMYGILVLQACHPGGYMLCLIIIALLLNASKKQDTTLAVSYLITTPKRGKNLPPI